MFARITLHSLPPTPQGLLILDIIYIEEVQCFHCYFGLDNVTCVAEMHFYDRGGTAAELLKVMWHSHPDTYIVFDPLAAFSFTSRPMQNSIERHSTQFQRLLPASLL